jgi:glycosyltransferase involved in cell wall biosynthesis
MSATTGYLNVSDDSCALIRVYVPTYRRNFLLQRALGCLRAQTFVDWKCEVHNDDPIDNFPTDLVNRLRDPRIEVCDHERNLGACATFNLFYRPTREPFYCLLEDDNWWEPEFLETMIRELRRHPEVTMAWCNQKVWEELPDGSWQDTGQFVNLPEQGNPRIIEFGAARQIMGAVHANGAMLLRSGPGEFYETLTDFPFAAVEAIRERMISHPLLYVPRPLAVFAKTRQTARSESRAEWAIAQTILAATFFKHANYSEVHIAELFADARRRRPPATNALLLAALVEPECRSLLRYAKMTDWLLLLRGVIRRPSVLWRVVQSRQRHANWWRFIDQHTAARFNQLRKRQAVNNWQLLC